MVIDEEQRESWIQAIEHGIPAARHTGLEVLEIEARAEADADADADEKASYELDRELVDAEGNVVAVTTNRYPMRRYPQ